MDAVIPRTATIEKLAGGFRFIEGPIWVGAADPHLVFSDLRGNAIYRWDPNGEIRAVRNPWAAPRGAPNGLALDGQGRLVVCDQSARRIAAREPGREPTTIVDLYEGQRFNSPNDVVIKSDGSVYFTDPPHGLSGEDESSEKELDFNGVFLLRPDGSLDVVSKEQTRPNGIALSPDETILYVSNSDSAYPSLLRYEVRADGTLGPGEILFDFAAAGREGVPDGVEVDSRGNVLVAGDGGIWILSREGRHLGTIEIDERPAGMAWGDDGASLYITAERGLYRVRLSP
jgi:gluconolactonase